MDHDVPKFFALLVVVLATARLFGALARRIGQPAVLGELLAGVALSMPLLGWVNPDDHTPNGHVLHLLAELGVTILLFEIGLETDLKKLLRVGGAAAAVAVVGVALPFALGYAACRLLGLENLTAIVAGATLTATSVGITARVLSELNRLQEVESQIILGAAVIDDVVGLIILAVVSRLTAGQTVSPLNIAWIALSAFGFLALALALGKLLVPPLIRWTSRIDLPGTPTMVALMLALGLAWLASVAGSALIIGAFAAGLLLRDTPQAKEIEKGVAHIGHFFVPIFFVTVGAAVDVRVLNPLNADNHRTLYISALLLVAAVVGKFLAGYAPLRFRGNKKVIGVGMIPRGEVGLIFAQMGLNGNVFDAALFSGVTLVVMATTFMAPPLLKLLFPPRPKQPSPPESDGIEDLVNSP